MVEATRQLTFARHLLDDLVSAGEQRLRNREAKRFGGLQVDDQLELGGFHDRQVAGCGALEDFPDINASLAVGLARNAPVAQKAAALCEFAREIHCRDPIARRQRNELRWRVEE